MHSDATALVRRAIEKGEILPASSHLCVVCDRPAAHYHHWSYDAVYFLDVIPLCSPCHVKVGNGVIYLNIGRVLHIRPTYKIPTVRVDKIVEEYVPDEHTLSYASVGFLSRLYGKDGCLEPASVLIDSKRETPGRIRIAIPSRAVKEELLRLGIIRPVTNGYMLNIETYPTRDTLPLV